MPKKLPRAFSCIILACMYHPPGANSAAMRDHVINGVDSMVRNHPDCGVLLTGDFNQLNDKFLKTQLENGSVHICVEILRKLDCFATKSTAQQRGCEKNVIRLK